MPSSVLLIIAAAGIALIVILIGLAVSLYVSLNRLTASFAKLGYLAREDTKKYFDDAARQAVDASKAVMDQNQAALKATLEQVVAEATASVKGIVGEAESEAVRITAAARDEASRVISQAEATGKQAALAASGRATAATEWALEQWVGQTFSVHDHANLIERLVTTYLNERS